MTIKNSLKNIILIDDNNDENVRVNWVDDDDIISEKEYYNCGCCDYCSCDEAPCANCSCECNSSTISSDPISAFDINIIDDNMEKKVRITFSFKLNNIMDETICIDLDINRSTYLKIADELN
jgi:hypothetical protein